jgi:hypothetical protein
MEGKMGSTVKRRRSLGVGVAVFGFCSAFVAGAVAASTDFAQPPTSPEAAGDGPSGIVAANFDGDADRDLAVANWNTGRVTILRNDGSGNFTEPASSPETVGGNPYGVVAADWDGDADLDLAVANRAGDNVTVLRNNGGGNFVQPATSPESVGDEPYALAAADLDGDADPDLAVANQGSNNLTVLRNNGGGNFFQPGSSPETVGADPYGVAAGDIEGDGDPDLTVVNYGSANVTVLRNNGGGNFVEPASSPEAVGFNPIGIAAADLDGDADPDLAVGNTSFPGLTILRNNGGGNFVQPASSPEPTGAEPRSVVAANFDGDADQDLAVTNASTTTVTIQRNNGGGNFVQPATSPETVGTWPYAAAAADLDGDADPDLAVANFLSDNVTILQNQ